MKQTSKKFLALTLATATTLSALSMVACGDPEGPQDGQTVIRMTGWGDTYETGIFQTMIDMFEEENPEYYVSYDPSGSDNYMIDLQNAIASPGRREMPDVFYMADYEFMRFAYQTDIFEDLNPYIEASENLSRDDLYEESITAYSFNEETQTMGDPNGALYGLPKDLGPTVLAYNKEIATKAGITIDRTLAIGYDVTTKKLNDQIPMTWAQYKRFLEDLQVAGKAETQNNKYYGAGSSSLELLYNSTGKRFTSYDEATGKTTMNINNDDFAMTLQFIADMEIQGLVASEETQRQKSGRDMFVMEEAATVFVGTWDTNSVWEATFDWDILPTPVPSTATTNQINDVTAPAREDCKNVTYLGSVCLSVFSGSKVKEGAYKLVEFLTTNQEAQKYNYEQGMAIPNRVSMMNEYMNATLADPMGMNRPQNRIVYKQQLENGSPRRMHAYTYNEGNAWTTKIHTNANDAYHLDHVYIANNSIAAYAPNYIVFDWSTGLLTQTPMSHDTNPKGTVLSGKAVLDYLSASAQQVIDNSGDEYDWKWFKDYNN